MISRFQIAQQETRLKILEENPWLLAEKVAHHYTSMAILAQSLKSITGSTGRSPNPTNVATVQSYMLGMIWRHHLGTFGAAPSWPVTPEAFQKHLAEVQEQLTKGLNEIH